MEHHEKELFERIIRGQEKLEHELKHGLERIDREFEHVNRRLNQIEREINQPKPITASVVDVFSGESIAMADLIFNVGQTSTDTVTPFLADGLTPSGGVVSNLTVAFSDPSATAVVNGTNTAMFTAVAPSTNGPVTGTRSCTITDTDGAVSQWTATFTVLVNAVIPPSQLTQSVADVFSVPTP